MENRFECPICLSFPSETKSDYFVSTRCGHIFHHSCIKRVTDRVANPECPACRKAASEASLTRLYGIECPELKDGIRVKNPHAKIDHTFKIVVLGDSGVGKSAFLRRFVVNAFHENMVTTVGCDLMAEKVRMGDKTIKLHLWDPSGQERYRSIATSFLRNAHAILLFYDISKSTSFANIDYWIKLAEDFGPANAVRMLIGNKADQEDLRMVSTRRGKKLGEREGITFFETSAKQSLNIEAVMRAATAEILEKPELLQQADFATRGRRLARQDNSKKPPTKWKCC